ncbi:MAG: methyltransferase domain-containing protein [Niveispirillum sp.]|uniref:class I SAM-dependent methyltransferase n=1 Tax=Asticcacaulis sp. TaxID=1872648 RepID=UPI001A3182C2|nr:methyltransferase domain-containing protein [Asticcacaulis sp.]MBJ7413855.1 methyltransferase domain-containing protein [Niveispirillum sp.]
MEVKLTAPFRHHDGHCFQKNVFDLALYADSPVGNRSNTVLLEDGKPLGPAHALHQDIAQKGRGAFSHWQQGLWFSTSDNSNPNNNGREYSIFIDESTIKGDHKSDLVANAVAQTLSVTIGYLREFRTHFSISHDHQPEVLEIGARYLGVAAILASMGAKVTVVEPEPIVWRSDFSAQFYETLRAEAPWHGLTLPDPSIIEAILHSEGEITPNITVLQTTGEEMDVHRFKSKFDFIFSNSVLEHIFDPQRVMENLAYCAKPWSHSRHGVDYRDHRNFDDPLGFMLLDDIEYRTKLVNKDTARGNRLRPSELEYWINRCGFSVAERKVREYNMESYINRHRELVLNSGLSRQYANCSAVDLYENSVLYTLTRLPD